MRVGILVGNAPCIRTFPWNKVPRDRIEIVTVNRTWDWTNPERQWVKPDWYCGLDSSIEECWLPPVGEVKGFLTRDQKPWHQRPDAIRRKWRTYSDRLPWPEKGQEYFRIRCSPAFAMQWMIEEEFTHIGIVGIEYSAKDLWQKGLETHAHGKHDQFDKTAQTLDGSRGVARALWTRIVHVCADRHIKAVNINPNAPTPFHSIPFACDKFDHWLKHLAPHSVSQVA